MDIEVKKRIEEKNEQISHLTSLANTHALNGMEYLRNGDTAEALRMYGYACKSIEQVAELKIQIERLQSAAFNKRVARFIQEIYEDLGIEIIGVRTK